MKKVSLRVACGCIALMLASGQAVAGEGVKLTVQTDHTDYFADVALPRQVSPGIEQAVAQFVAEMQAKDRGGLHSVMVLQHGKVKAAQWVNGYTADSLNTLNSVTKTFTAMAVGLAISEGKLKVTDKVASFFPDQLPQTVSDNLKALEVRHLLTMTTGFGMNPGNRMTAPDNDLVRAFLKVPLDHKPGTFFCYSSMNSYMLSAIVQKVTGEKLYDYLYPRLFRPLGISGITWAQSKQGINEGGWGLRVKTEDMAKLGQLILQRGRWNGRRVIPSKWIKEMTTKKVESYPAWVKPEEVKNLTPDDWTQGYCYQMWRCLHNAVRADGAGGQYILVLPEKDAVIAITSSLMDMGGELKRVWKYILPAL